MTPMVARIEGLLLTGGWALVWFFAVALAIWQILRGRALAGVSLGAAAVLGLGSMALHSTLQALFAGLSQTLGYTAGDLIGGLVYGAIDALILFLLIAAAVLQRPPRPTES